LAGEFCDFGQELADLGNFGEVAEFGSDFGKGIGRRSGESELFGVSGAEEATRFDYRLTAMAAALGEGWVQSGRESTSSTDW